MASNRLPGETVTGRRARALAREIERAAKAFVRGGGCIPSIVEAGVREDSFDVVEWSDDADLDDTHSVEDACLFAVSVVRDLIVLDLYVYGFQDRIAKAGDDGTLLDNVYAVIRHGRFDRVERGDLMTEGLRNEIARESARRAGEE